MAFGEQQPTSATEECSARCSFCGKDPAPVGQLVQGQDLRAYICQECAQLCLMIFDHQNLKHCAELGPDQRATFAATWQLLSKMIDHTFSGLTPLERDVVKLRYGLSKGYSYSYEDAAALLELTPAHVADVEREAVEKLRPRGS